ncbi:MAG: manganese efflux pump [Salinivirgaceae bacterium]|nr:manganese efflux pump [Salinivirgaceae bacterium]
MNFLSLLLIAIGLAMDSVTVSISCGLILNKFNIKNTLRIALFMGFFQGIMPVIGWLLGSTFKGYIEAIDHWIAFFILLFLGTRMIYQQLTSNNEYKCFDPTSNKVLLGLALATSIDALAVGVTFSIVHTSLLYAASIIASTSFVLSFMAVYLASIFKNKLKFPFELVGGIILISIGLKILIEHLSQ